MNKNYVFVPHKDCVDCAVEAKRHTPPWMIILQTKRPGGVRPRFFSLHTLAAITGRTNLRELAEEMKASKQVASQFCPIVKAYVYYPMTYAHGPDGHYGDYGFDWSKIDKHLEQYPYPKVRGFREGGYWTGGTYGVGHYVANNAMADPFVKEDYAYANTILDKLIEAGHTPAIEKYKV